MEQRADIDLGLSAGRRWRYLMPQILTNVTHDMRVMREESLGPWWDHACQKRRRGDRIDE